MDETIRQALGIARGIWQRRWVGVAAAWAVSVIGLVVLAKMPDRYEATARVYVDTTTLLRPLIAGLAVEPDLDQQVAMLARTLLSRPNIEKLVGKAGLIDGAASQADRDRLVDRIVRQLQFTMTGRGNVYSVTFRDTDPVFARTVVQALVSTFVELGLGDKRRDTEASQRFINEQIALYEERLREAENRRKEFRLRNLSMTSVGAAAGGQDYVSRMAAAAEELSRARMELRIAEQARDALKRELAGEESASILPETVIAQALPATTEHDARIDAQKRQLDDLLRRFTDEHPDVAQTRRMIASLEEQRRLELEARRKALAAAALARKPGHVGAPPQQIRLVLTESEASVAAQQARVSELQARFDQLRASANRVPQIEVELAQLNRDYDLVLRNYQQLVSRREAAQLTGEVDQSAGLADFRVIDPPRVGEHPVSPNRMTLFPLLFLAALASGVGAAFLASQISPRFHSTKSLRDIGGRPVLGSISLRLDSALIRRRRFETTIFGTASAGMVAAYAIWLLVT